MLSISCFTGVFFNTDRRWESLCVCSFNEVFPVCSGVIGGLLSSNISSLSSSPKLTFFLLRSDITLLLTSLVMWSELKSLEQVDRYDKDWSKIGKTLVLATWTINVHISIDSVHQHHKKIHLFLNFHYYSATCTFHILRNLQNMQKKNGSIAWRKRHFT